MGLDDAAADRQPQPGAAQAAGVLQAIEAVEDALQVVGGDARPAVGHGDLDLAPLRAHQNVDRLIRGLSPFPGAWTDIAGERVKLLRSRVVSGAGKPGELLGGFTVACGAGAVEIVEAQREGKRPMPAVDLLRGWDLPVRLT